MRNEQRAWFGTAGSETRQNICRAGPLGDGAVAMYRHQEGVGILTIPANAA
jgi:hypothetical protein